MPSSRNPVDTRSPDATGVIRTAPLLSCSGDSGVDPLAPQPLTKEQVRDLVKRARANAVRIREMYAERDRARARQR